MHLFFFSFLGKSMEPGHHGMREGELNITKVRSGWSCWASWAQPGPVLGVTDQQACDKYVRGACRMLEKQKCGGSLSRVNRQEV